MNGEVKRNGSVRWPHSAWFSLSLIAAMWLLTACVATTKYTPTIIPTTPEQSESTTSKPILLTVRTVKLVDASPVEDKEDGGLYGSGWSVTAPERLNGDLVFLLTDAIVKDLRSHGLFKDLAQDHQDGQIVLGGKIHRFYQRRTHYLWALCCGLLGMLLPFPLMKEEGEVDLEIILTRLDGSTIKSYRGKSSFLKRCNFYGSRCWESYNNSPALYLDQALGDSLHQIRQLIMQDGDLISHEVSDQPLKLP